MALSNNQMPTAPGFQDLTNYESQDDPIVKIMQDAGWYVMPKNHVYIPAVDGPPMILGDKVYLPGQSAIGGETLKNYLGTFMNIKKSKVDTKSFLGTAKDLGIMNTQDQSQADTSSTDPEIEQLYADFQDRVSKATTADQVLALRDYYLPLIKRLKGENDQTGLGTVKP